MSRPGTNDCAHCGEESYVYEPWPSCRSCLAETCDRCQAKGSEAAGDGTPITVRCKACDVPASIVCEAAYDDQHVEDAKHHGRCRACGDRMPTTETLDHAGSAAYWGELASYWIGVGISRGSTTGAIAHAARYATYAGTCARLALEQPSAST